MEVTLNDQQFVLHPKQFAGGVLGWDVYHQAVTEVSGVEVPVTLEIKVTIDGSKYLPR